MQATKHMAEAVGEKLSQVVNTLTTTSGTPKTFTRASGCPFGNLKHSLTAGPNGPVVHDVNLFEKLQAFDREKIPARNVHALGNGAYGSLTVTNDISKYSKAKVFTPGKTTEFFLRLSGTFTEQGEAQSFRDLRGFAMKFYTEQGNWDLMTINTPVFAVRDAKPGPDQVHAFKRDPRNGFWNVNAFWDYNANAPEGLHQTAMLYCDHIGTPRSLRFQDWFACNTYSMINAQNQRTWVKFHLKNQQGEKNGFTLDEVKIVAGEEPEFLMKDVHSAIEAKKFPKWKLMIQVMPEDEGYQQSFAFDCTKVWPEKQFPLIEVGDVVLNKLPINYFAEVEQVAFSPANIVPGISLSPDKLLQGRIFIYDDTQRHRIGPNFKQLPINCPRNAKAQNNYYGGNMNLENEDKFPHYALSVYGGFKSDEEAVEPPLRVDGPVDFYPAPKEGTDEDYYGQVIEFWNSLNSYQRERMCLNFASSLAKVDDQRIIDLMIGHFRKCSEEWARSVQEKIQGIKGADKPETQKMVEKWQQELLA
jgi:catalase